MAAFLREVEKRQAGLVQRGVNLNTPQGKAQLEQEKQLTLDNMIDDVLVTQDAARQGVAVSDAELDAELQKIISSLGGQAKFEEQLKFAGQTLDDARSMQRMQMLYLKMRDRVVGGLQTAEQVHARHILVDSQATAQALLAQIQAGADFGQVAQQSSQDTLTRANGGDLGWFARGTLPCSRGKWVRWFRALSVITWCKRWSAIRPASWKANCLSKFSSKPWKTGLTVCAHRLKCSAWRGSEIYQD
jgi:parvulin-like peptidyl-prolyl isomerase